MKKSLFIGLLSLPLVIGCATDNNKTDHDSTTTVEPNVQTEHVENVIHANVTLSPKSNSNVSGTVTFTERNGKVSMNADLKGLSEGKHAIHIHEYGDCSSADGKSAGGHWNPTNENHGKWGVKPFHKGDIGNLVADANGHATYSRETDLWCIGCNDETKNIVGKSIIVHKGPDDFSSQPAGAAGARVACGEIMKK